MFQNPITFFVSYMYMKILSNLCCRLLTCNKIVVIQISPNGFLFYMTESIESEDDIREFVKAKIESLVANVAADQDVVTEMETNRFKSATTRFHRIFNIPAEEKLVNCKS